MNIFYTDTTESSFNNFMKAYGMWFAIGVAAVLAIVLLVILFVCLAKRKETKPQGIKKMDNDEVFIALGGKDNVIEHHNVGSRLSLVLKNYDAVDVKKLNELGFPSVIRMSNKITLVYEGDLEELSNRLFN